MAPGDLNLKKSWYPKLMKNQAKVWEMEQEALLEHKKIQERQLEFEKEKQKKELIDLQVKNNPHLKDKLISNRIDWMYDDPSKNKDNFVDDDERDDFLLGKKKIDLKASTGNNTTVPKPKNDRLSGALAIGGTSQVLPSDRDLKTKARDDPMMRIRQEQLERIKVLQREKLLKDQLSRESSRVRSVSRHGDRYERDRYRSGRDGRYGGEREGDRYKSSRESDRYTSREGDKYRSDREGHKDSDRHRGDRGGERHRSSRERDHDFDRRSDRRDHGSDSSYSSSRKDDRYRSDRDSIDRSRDREMKKPYNRDRYH